MIVGNSINPPLRLVYVSSITFQMHLGHNQANTAENQGGH